jgi:DNA-binding transcriptional MerR regulator
MADPVEAISDDWYDSKSAARLLKINIRTLQKWAKRGLLEFKTVVDGKRRIRLYTAESVHRFREFGPRQERKAPEPGIVPLSPHQPRAPKQQQLEPFKQPFETEVFLSVLEKAQKANEALLAQMETQARIGADTLKDVVAQIFAAQQADRDEDRYRFDAVRKDKQERLKSRHTHGAPPSKRKA